MRFIVFILVLFLATEIHAAILYTEYFTGFENGDTSELNATSGTLSIQSTTKNSGTYAVRVNPTTTNTGYIEIKKHDTGTASTEGLPTAIFNEKTLYWTFYFRVDTLPSSLQEQILEVEDTSGLKISSVRIDSSGILSAYDPADGLMGSASTALTTGSFHRLDMLCNSGTIDGQFDLWIDSVSQFTGGSDLNGTNIGAIRFGKTTNLNGKSVDYYFDDISVSSQTFVSSSSVKAMIPDSNGTYNQWTVSAGGHPEYIDIYEIPNDGDTTALDGGGGSNVSTFNLQSSTGAGIGSTIIAIKPMVTCKRTSPGASIVTRIRTNSTDFDSSSESSLIPYETRAFYKVFNPSTVAAWTTSDLDSMEIGFQDTGSGTRCTNIVTSVLYSGTSGGGSTPSNGIQPRSVYWGGVGTK